MKKEYSISIIIPIYNSERYIRECVNSIFCQDMDCLEYIFVDDCSSDNSIAIIETLLYSKYSHLKDNARIIKLEKNGGIANARNIGLSNARGEYIGFVDSDDWIEPNMFSEMYKRAVETEADILCCSFINEYSNNRSIFKQPYSDSIKQNIRGLLTGELFPSLWCEIVKRSLFEENKINFVASINMGEDLLVNIKLFVYAKRISFINKALYHYRHSDTSVCAVRSLDSIMNDIYVAFLIEKFLISVNIADQFRKEILSRKFFAKLPLWTMPEYRDVDLWRNTFLEANRYIYSYSRLDWKMKLEYWLASHGMEKFAVLFVHLLSIKSKFNL